MVLRFFYILLITILIFLKSEAQQTAEKFIWETHYLLSLPSDYELDSTRKWPLLLFLHGSGESGHDLQKVKIHGPPKLVEKGKKFPMIIVSPQAYPGIGWDPEGLYQLIQHIKRTRHVDNDRIYVTGLSMGGYGTWALAMKHPEEFAAIAPVCGGGDTSEIWRIRNLPVWNFHGAKDDVVPPSESEKMVNAARKYNKNVKYTLYPEANHNSWDSAYNNDALYNWMLLQKRFRYTEVSVTSDKLKIFTGSYRNKGNDSLKIVQSDGQLIIHAGRDTIPIKAAGAGLFFIHPNEPAEFRFILDKYKVTGFEFLGHHKEYYRKL
jgi:pimeloyl-ACP methyl ester carboxylesterase